MEFKSYLRCPAYFESMMNLDGMGWLQTTCKHCQTGQKVCTAEEDNSLPMCSNSLNFSLYSKTYPHTTQYTAPFLFSSLKFKLPAACFTKKCTWRHERRFPELDEQQVPLFLSKGTLLPRKKRIFDFGMLNFTVWCEVSSIYLFN